MFVCGWVYKYMGAGPVQEYVIAYRTAAVRVN